MESSNKQGEGKGMPGGGVVAIGISGVSLIVNGILFMRRAGVPAKPFDIDQGHVGAGVFLVGLLLFAGALVTLVRRAGLWRS